MYGCMFLSICVRRVIFLNVHVYSLNNFDMVKYARIARRTQTRTRGTCSA
jgi:hypothetical protein